jgi:hypothetical protein
MKFLFFPINIILRLLFFFILFIFTCFPLFFGCTTFFLSVLMFGKLEYDKALHDREFYSNQTPKEIILLFIGLSTKLQVLIQSIALSLLTVILFSGTNIDRTVGIALILLFLVYVGSWVLRLIERISNVNIERWGYVKISLLLGILFSLLISTVEGLSIWDIGTSILKNQMSELNLNEVGELSFALVSQINNLLENIFTKVFGEIAGKFISLLFTTNTMFGFVLYIYVLQYIRLQDKYDNFVNNITSRNTILDVK